MLPIETVVLFFTASIALAVAPGPDNIFVLTQSALHGRKAGIMVTLGLCTGILVHTAAVSLGVSAIFQTSAVAFNVLKLIGAAYLLYLAWQAFRAGSIETPASEGPGLTTEKLYLRGVIMNITNPKVAIFFLAFLPQFADPGHGMLTLQMITLGTLFILATILVFGTVAWFAGFLGKWLRQSEKTQKVMNQIAGTVFAGLALRLAFAQR